MTAALEAIRDLQTTNDAFRHMVSRLGADNWQLSRQVTDVQRRCTELIEENRALKAKVAALEAVR